MRANLENFTLIEETPLDPIKLVKGSCLALRAPWRPGRWSGWGMPGQRMRRKSERIGGSGGSGGGRGGEIWRNFAKKVQIRKSRRKIDKSGAVSEHLGGGMVGGWVGGAPGTGWVGEWVSE